MHIILIDGKNALFRHGSVHPNLRASDGTLTGAAYGLTGCLLRLKAKYPDSRFVMCWDGSGKTWRHELYSEYKGNRKRGSDVPPAVQNVLAQAGTVEALCNALGIIQITVPSVEADDVIGILAVRCLKREWIPVIYSSDKDFMQLMPRGVLVIRDVDKTVKLAPESEKSVLNKFGCTPEQILSVRALCGDKSDNIPNVLHLMGPKTATKLICAGVCPEYKDGLSGGPLASMMGIAAVPRAWAALAPVWQDVRRNYKLMRILTSCTAKVLPVHTQGFLRASIACVISELAASLNAGKRSGRREMVKFLAGLDLDEAIEQRMALWRLQS